MSDSQTIQEPSPAIRDEDEAHGADSPIAPLPSPAEAAGEPTPASWGERVRRWVFGAQDAQTTLAERLAQLQNAIARFPDSYTHYVVRGELYLSIGAADHAAADFRRALELAEAALTSDRWGVLAQTMRDRAAAGLAQANRP